jgi:hypothetical protein
MVSMAFAMPLLPGKQDVLKTFVTALKTERAAEFNAAQTTVVQESWFVQSTPMGDLIICQFQSPDPLMVLSNLAGANDEFAMWFKAQILDITGVDFGNPPDQLPIERVFDWSKAK